MYKLYKDWDCPCSHLQHLAPLTESVWESQWSRYLSKEFKKWMSELVWIYSSVKSMKIFCKYVIESWSWNEPLKSFSKVRQFLNQYNIFGKSLVLLWICLVANALQHWNQAALETSKYVADLTPELFSRIALKYRVQKQR